MLCGENYELRAGNKGHRSLTPKEQAANVLHFGRPFFISPDPHCELENDSSSTANLTGSSVRTPSLPSKTGCPHHCGSGTGCRNAEDTLRRLPGAPRCPRPANAPAPQSRYYHIYNPLSSLLYGPGFLYDPSLGLGAGCGVGGPFAVGGPIISGAIYITHWADTGAENAKKQLKSSS